MSTFKKKKKNQQATFKRVQSFIHRSIRKEVQQETSRFASGPIFWGVLEDSSFGISLVTFSSVFFFSSLFTKQHVK